MKWMQSGLLFFLVCYQMTSLAFAERVITVNVPFQNILLNPNDTIIGNFSFGPQSQLFCFENTLQTIGVIHWPYQGTVYGGTLPIFLTLNPTEQGQLTDPNGALNIFNNQTYTLVVSCIYSM